jgi:tetratricopeptide (TPR) repeat protein
MIPTGTGQCPAEEMYMKSTMTAVAALLAGAAFAASPAAAQQSYGAPSMPQQAVPETQQQQAAPEQAKAGQPKVSREAAKALKDLQDTVNANNAADVPAKVAAANAVAKTPDDKYMVGVLQYKFATAAKDDTARAAAVEEMIASGFKGAPVGELYTDLGATYSRLNQAQRAVDAYQHALQLNPSSIDATAGLAEAKASAGQAADAIALLQKGIALQSAGGAKAPETWYTRALQIAWKAKLPQAIDISREWIAAYPTSKAWTNALAVYQNLAPLDESQTLDLMRLKRAAGVLTPADYFNYGDIAVRKGFAGEAKSVLEQGFAANLIKNSDPSFSQLYSVATAKTKGDLESLPAAPSATGTAKVTLNAGDAYYGYGKYDKAAEFYRAALSKAGADTSLINLHLGMALARQGDKAGAAAAFKAVRGANAALAQYWLLYASQA